MIEFCCSFEYVLTLDTDQNNNCKSQHKCCGANLLKKVFECIGIKIANGLNAECVQTFPNRHDILDVFVQSVFAQK